MNNIHNSITLCSTIRVPCDILQWNRRMSTSSSVYVFVLLWNHRWRWHLFSQRLSVTIVPFIMFPRFLLRFRLLSLRAMNWRRVSSSSLTSAATAASAKPMDFQRCFTVLSWMALLNQHRVLYIVQETKWPLSYVNKTHVCLFLLCLSTLASTAVGMDYTYINIYHSWNTKALSKRNVSRRTHIFRLNIFS